MDVEELSARLEIQQVILDLARGTDRRDAALMADCYHPDAYDDHNMFRGSAADFVELVTSASDAEWLSCTHAPSPARIEVLGDRAWAETILVAHHVSQAGPDGHRDLVIGARMEDAFERRDDRWRIARRTVIYDWVGELALTPGDRPTRRMPLPDDFHVGRLDASDPSYRLRRQALGLPSA